MADTVPPLPQGFTALPPLPSGFRAIGGAAKAQKLSRSEQAALNRAHTGEQFGRGLAQVGEGLNTGIAGLAALPQEAVSGAMRLTGLPASPAGAYFQKYQGIIPGLAKSAAETMGLPYQETGEPRNVGERINRFVGEQLGAVGSTLGLARGVARLAPGTTTGRVAREVAAQPAAQAAAAAAGGVAQGVTNDPLVGAGVAMVTPAATSLMAGAARRAVSPITNIRNAEERRLAQTMNREGIPMTAGQETGSRPLRSAEATLGTMPFSGGPAAERERAQWSAYTRAVNRRAGIHSDSVAPDVIDDRFRSLGQTFERLVGNTNAPIDNNFRAATDRITYNYGRVLQPNQKKVLKDQIDALTSLNGMRITKIAGEVYKTERDFLTRQINQYRPKPGNSGDPELAKGLTDLRNALDDAMQRASPADLRDEWRLARRQWANLETIADAQAGAALEKGAAGYVSPAQLKAALARSVGRDKYARGFGDLNDLARAGGLYVKETIPNSGTPERTFWQRAFTGSMPVVGGGAAGYATGGNPLAMAAGAAAPFALPRAADWAMFSGPGQRYLTNQAAAGVRGPQVNRELLAALLAEQAQNPAFGLTGKQ